MEFPWIGSWGCTEGRPRIGNFDREDGGQVMGGEERYPVLRPAVVATFFRCRPLPDLLALKWIGPREAHGVSLDRVLRMHGGSAASASLTAFEKRFEAS